MTTQQEQQKFIKSFYKVSTIRRKPQSDRTKQIINLIDMKYINKSLLTVIKKDINRYETATERVKKGIYKKYKDLGDTIDYILQHREFKPSGIINNFKDLNEYKENLYREIHFKELIEKKREFVLTPNKERMIQHILVNPKKYKFHGEQQKDTGTFGVLVDSKQEVSSKTANEVKNNVYNERFNNEIFNIVYRLFKKTKNIIDNTITNTQEIEERLKEIKRMERQNEMMRDFGLSQFTPKDVPNPIEPIKSKLESFNIQFLLLQKISGDDDNERYLIFHSPINNKYGDLAENEEDKANYFYYIDNLGEKREIDFNLIRSASSDSERPFIIGFTVYITYSDNTDNVLRLKEPDILRLKAFSAQNNFSYHTLTEYSTNNNKLCIYESYLYNIGLFDAKYKTNNNVNEMMKQLNNMLSNESEELQQNIKEGNLIQSLKLLTDKYKKPAYITFYNSNIKQSLKVFNNNFVFVDEDEVKKEYALLYCEKDQHIAPRKRDHNFIVKDTNNNISNNYGLRKNKAEIKNNTIDNVKYILSYDIETYTDDNGTQRPFLICLYGINNETNEIINLSFYGFNCVIEFVKYLIDISTKLNHTKTHTTTQNKYIYIYGFNNTNFDNIYIFNEIKNNINYVDFTFSNNGIKYIEFDNVKIFDLCLYYQGSLKNISKNFKLEDNKAVYPYKFVNKHNINYIGNVPEIEYWNDVKDYEEYINLNGLSFDLKEYSIKYCMLDAKLTHLISLEHLKLSVGQIKGINYNVSTSQTCSALSMKIYNQVFQTDDLYQSPDKIYIKEKQSYKAGKVDVFKKAYNNEDNILYYCDRNSSYPASMLGEMPFKYISSNNINHTITRNYNFFVDTNLYLAKSKYIGTNKNVIPNLLTRSKNKEIKATLETEWDYFWGVELKEAIKNDFNIYVKEVNIYETKILFKEFVEYFYNERQKNKNINNSLYIFYKTILNSFSGKFGQKAHTQTKLLNKNENWMNYINKDTHLIDIKFIGDNTLIKYENKINEDLSIGKLVRFISYITANARSNLSEIMRNVGHNNIYYCDTDSIFSSVKPNDKFLDNNELGKWKIEDKIKEAYFIGKKSYAYKNIDDKIINKCKGVDASKINFNQYKNLTDDNNIKVVKNMFYKSYNGVKIISTERTIRTTYNKRIFDGNNSTAYEK